MGVGVGSGVWRWQRLKECGSQSMFLEVSGFLRVPWGVSVCVRACPCVYGNSSVGQFAWVDCVGSWESARIGVWCAAGCLDLCMELGVSDFCPCVGEDVCTTTPGYIIAHICLVVHLGGLTPTDLTS